MEDEDCYMYLGLHHGALYGADYKSLSGAIAGSHAGTRDTSPLFWDVGADLGRPQAGRIQRFCSGAPRSCGSPAWRSVLWGRLCLAGVGRVHVEAWSRVDPSSRLSSPGTAGSPVRWRPGRSCSSGGAWPGPCRWTARGVGVQREMLPLTSALRQLLLMPSFPCCP